MGEPRERTAHGGGPLEKGPRGGALEKELRSGPSTDEGPKTAPVVGPCRVAPQALPLTPCR